MPDHDHYYDDLAALTMDERQDRANDRVARQKEKIDVRRRELNGKMEWPDSEDE